MKDEHAEPLLQTFDREYDPADTETHIQQHVPSSKGKRLLLASACLYFAGSLIVLITAVLLRRPQVVVPPNAQLLYCQSLSSPYPHESLLTKRSARSRRHPLPSNKLQSRHTPQVHIRKPSIPRSRPRMARSLRSVSPLLLHLSHSSRKAEVGISWVTPQEAALLPNATSRIPNTPDKYIVGLDVFHQLHCLDELRKALAPEYYGDDAGMHVSHCMEHLRQAVMCNVDVSTVYWTWSEPLKKNLADARVAHTCRDFGAVKEWAEGRIVEGGFDDTVFVEGGPVHVEEEVW